MGRTQPVGAVKELSRIAEEAAMAAGSVLREAFGERGLVDRITPHDVKLAVDRVCEEEVLRVLMSECPNHAVLSEEMGYEPGSEPYLWIVDPLDGTVNFHHGIPFFCSSVACYAIGGDGDAPVRCLLEDGRPLGAPISGAVYDPLRSELFAAAAGGGASLNRRPLRPLESARLEDSIVSMSFGAADESIAYASRALPRLARFARKVRSFGSTALESVDVAAGRTGAFVQMGTNLWDFAGAAVIALEVGATFDCREIVPGRFRIIACAPGLIDEILRHTES